MPSTVEKISTTRAKITVEIPFAELKPALDKAYQQLASQVNIPGFRKGKVPAAVINQRFGRGSLLNEAINEVLPDAYGKAVAEHNLAPLGQPDVEITRLEDGDVVEFVAEVDVRPDFDMPDFAGIAVEVEDHTVTDDEVDERIELLRKRFSTKTDVERAAAAGDLVNLDLEASQNGEVLPDAAAQGVTYVIGTGGMLDGLDEAVTGLEAGGEARFATTLVGGPYKDQPVDVQVVVNKVQQEDLPEVNDDFAQLVSQFDTVAEMRADLHGAVAANGRLAQASQARDKVLEAALELVAFDVPESVVAREVEVRTSQINAQLKQAGMTVETFLEQSDDEESETPDEFWASVARRSEQSLRAQILLDRIADDNQIGVDQADLTQLIFRKAQENGTSPEQEIQHMQEHNHLPEWMGEVRRGKALGFLLSAATVTSASGAVLDLSLLNADGTISDGTEAAQDDDETTAAAQSPDSPESADSPDSPDSPASPASPAEAPAAE